MRRLLTVALLPALLAAAPTGYHILNEIRLGGEGGWDYLTVDTAGRRLYVSHATHVVVVDVESGKVAGDIPDTPGVHGIAVAPELNKGFMKKKSAEWVEILNAAGVPCGPIYSMDQVFADPQVKHLQAAAEVEHPTLGKIRLINQPVKLSRTPARLTSASPGRGAHTDEVLREAGYKDSEISEFRAAKVV